MWLAAQATGGAGSSGQGLNPGEPLPQTLKTY
jgi:hypothetical protein